MSQLIAISILAPAAFGKAALFAAGGEIIIILLVFVFIFIPLIGTALSRMKAPPPPKGGARPARPAATGQVQSEIEDFLRRASQKKSAGGTRPQQRAKPARAILVEKPPRAELVRAEVVNDRAVGGKVEQHVKKYLDEEEFTRRTEKLGEDVAEADDKIERHLKSVFDHSLSKIAATPGVTASPPNAKLADSAPEITIAMPSIAADDVAALFGNPLSIRQAVIINEILNRPLERWDREASFDTAAWERRKV
jgi:hypothetical protein